ncbi:hypothetical protein GALMADRAFT_205254 [Galerina marginata CBS 339.88]|uniref:T6SS Phospholipase effector Tle1-like catalytic domain-containing protein n=1 Tax=Galerina marginata (strain CBS 339.88) TaxID=685588 RepID=A0A067TS40_GALM3|nr:hypothetical protein GALMADRAFT_205254 [Galerina marginata CBS 339.88]
MAFRVLYLEVLPPNYTGAYGVPKKDDPEQQMVYYQVMLGLAHTYFKSNLFNLPTPKEMALGLKWGEKHLPNKKPKRRQVLHELEQFLEEGNTLAVPRFFTPKKFQPRTDSASNLFKYAVLLSILRMLQGLIHFNISTHFGWDRNTYTSCRAEYFLHVESVNRLKCVNVPLAPGFPNSASEVPLEPTIPPDHEHRTVILCFDGTGNQFDDDNSNIVNFFTMLKKDDPEQQMVYYQAGIGTYTVPQIATPMMAKLYKLMDAMTRLGIKFSSLVGLLPRDNHQQVPFAYKMYSREDKTGWEQSAAFKKAFSIDVDIELIGVWDTVGSVGLVPKRLPFTTFNTHVKNFCQALSLDEHRVRFKPNFFSRPTPEEMGLGLKWGEKHIPKTKPTRRHTLRELEHVGGGAVKNEVRNNLARISLRWMIRECSKLKTGILFHRDSFKMAGLDPTTLWPRVLNRPAPVVQFSGTPPKEKRDLSILVHNGAFADVDDFVNEEEDLADALSDKNDMLSISRSWWIMVNRGRGRVIPKQRAEGIKIHRTVQLRMKMKEEERKPYKPNAKVVPDVEQTWVV